MSWAVVAVAWWLMVWMRPVQASQFACDKIMVNSGAHVLDLSPEFEKGPITAGWSRATPPSTTISNVTMDLCKPLPQLKQVDKEDQCPYPTNACMTVTSRRGKQDQIVQVVPVAGTGEGLRLLDTASNPDETLDVELQFQGRVWAEREQTMYLRVLCGAYSQLEINAYDPDAGELQLQWNTPQACFNARRKPAQKQSRSGHFSLWWFMIFVALMYLGVGMWYNHHQYGATGWDLLPHRDMWRELPYVASDFWRHVSRTWQGSTSVGGNMATGRYGYEPV